MARTAQVQRRTAETDIQLELNLDGAGDRLYDFTTAFRLIAEIRSGPQRLFMRTVSD